MRKKNTKWKTVNSVGHGSIKGIYVIKKIVQGNNIFKLGLIVSVIPFILLCCYVYPGYDDFNYYGKIVEMGLMNSQVYWYKYWTGRFFSTAFISSVIFTLITFKKTIFINYYGIIPLSSFAILFVGLFTLIKTASFKKLSVKECLWGALVFFVIYIAKVPTIQKGFYGLASSYTYQIGKIAILFLLSLFLHSSNITSYSKKQKFAYSSACCFLTSAIIGSNEITMVTLLVLVAFAAPYVMRKERPDLFLWKTLLGACLIFTLIAVLAPGNFSRGEILGREYSTGNTRFVISNSIRYSLMYSSQLFLKFLFSPVLIGAILAFIPTSFSILERLEIKNKIKARHLFIFLILWSEILAIPLFPNYWVGGFHPPLYSINLPKIKC